MPFLWGENLRLEVHQANQKVLYHALYAEGLDKSQSRQSADLSKAL